MTRLLPLRALSDPRDLIRHFTPNWFTVNMGLGITVLALLQLPFELPGRTELARSLYWFDLALFALFSVLLLARLLCYAPTLVTLLRHPVASMFIGAIPMALAPLINGLGVMCPQLTPAWLAGLWWVDVVLSLLAGWLVPLAMFMLQEHSAQSMTALWLLPLVPCEVAASSGGILALRLPQALAYPMVVTSYALWGLSVLMALGVLAILFFRLSVHKLPPKELGVSSWLALGPLGTGSLALQTLGAAAPHALASSALAPLAALALPIGVAGALALWGLGLWWLGAAVVMTLVQLRRGLPFNLGWWGLTFPLGVFIAATGALGRNTGIGAFTWAAGAMTLWLAAIAGFILVRSLHGLWHGHLVLPPAPPAPAMPAISATGTR